MIEVATKSGQASRPKSRYHHGDLREALISASYDLVNQQGAEAFSLADACRLAKVSTAAPYRHFKDRDELMAEVCARGFGEMTSRAVEAVEAKGEGTIEGMIAMGHAYINFALEQNGIFRLMFGGSTNLEAFDHVQEIGNECFGYLIRQIMTYCAAHNVDQDPDAVAARMWTFVHGASALLMDGKYEKVAPDLDVMKLVAEATPMLLGVSTKPA